METSKHLLSSTAWVDNPRTHVLVAIVAAAALATAMITYFPVHRILAAEVILLTAIWSTSIPLLIEFFRNLLKGNFSVDVLAILSIATSLILKEYWAAIIIILMLSGGKALEEYATRRASSVLSALAKRMPQVAHRISRDGDVSDVSTDAIAIGDAIELYPHELCPVDGLVLHGNGSMDESYLTGEPFLIAKAPGSIVLSGAINGDAALKIKATHIASDSRYAKIVEVLRASEENRPQIRRLGDRIGRWYTPIALTIAIVSWIIGGDPDRFLSVLVIATPCPLLIAIPVAIIGAISVGARRGIVIRDPSILEKLDSCKTLVVDKTGTLTYGKPSLTEIHCTTELSRSLLLQLAASLERYSKHPLATAVIEAAEEQKLDLLEVQEVSEAPGTGLRGKVADADLILTSRGKLAPEAEKRLPPISPGLECVLLVDGKLAGTFHFHDQPRHESKSFLRHLKARHAFDHVVLLSGDRPAEVSHFASVVGISTVHGGKSPEEKVSIVRELTRKAPTLYLGDGINDAPAMMNATAGIALGVNSDITSEAAGAVILQSSLESVDELIHIGNRMRRIALTSAVGGMLLSLAGMGAASAGFITPVEGAIAQEVIDLLSILNSLRMIMPSGPLSDFRPSTAVEGKEIHGMTARVN